MRRMLLLSLMAVTLAGFAKAQEVAGKQSDPEEIKREVLKVEEEMTQASAKRDIAVLERIFADDMVWTARGDVLTKPQVLADFRSENDKLSNVNHFDIRLHPYGNIVILTGRSTSTVRYKGKISNGPRLYTQVYVKLDGRWQLVSHQVTDISN